jgi:hypothetical protein
MFYTVRCSIIANENQQNTQMIYIFSICSTYIFANENQQNTQMIYIFCSGKALPFLYTQQFTLDISAVVY